MKFMNVKCFAAVSSKKKWRFLKAEDSKEYFYRIFYGTKNQTMMTIGNEKCMEYLDF